MLLRVLKSNANVCRSELNYMNEMNTSIRAPLFKIKKPRVVGASQLLSALHHDGIAYGREIKVKTILRAKVFSFHPHHHSQKSKPF